jgi:SAM-dependent methyltransferase
MSLKEDDEMRDNVRAFVAAAAESFSLPGPVYEFGSYIVPGQESIGDLRPLFAGREYVGCDMREGPGVDQVEDISRLSMADESVPSIVCVETLEHVFEVRRAVDEIIRVLAPGGIVLISTPFNFYLHNYPGDYWRITPSCLDGLLAPLGAVAVGWQGVESFPHTVFAVGCKAPVPTTFAAGFGRFTASFDRRLAELAAAEPWQKKWKRKITGFVRSKGERRREREYYRSQFVLSYREKAVDSIAALRNVYAATGVKD